MALFQVLFSKKSERDFERLDPKDRESLGRELKNLESNPFPFKKRTKKIKGTRQALYRLRVDLPSQSYRVFYTVQKPNQVILLRIVPKKEADRILSNLI